MRASVTSLVSSLVLSFVAAFATSCRSTAPSGSEAEANRDTTPMKSIASSDTAAAEEPRVEPKPVAVQVRTSDAAANADDVHPEARANSAANPSADSRSTPSPSESSTPKSTQQDATNTKTNVTKIVGQKDHGDDRAANLARAAAELPNRDKHGNADVTKYIDGLQRQDRVADLQVDVVLQKLALPTDAIVGDLGCGPGVFTTAFARQCTEGIVYASDIEPRQLDVVREKIRATNLRNIVPVLASEDDPHFPPGTLDIVFVADTYHHLDDRVAYMKRLGKSLKPGGRLVLLEYKPGQLPVGPPADHKPAAGVMARELTDAGWKLVESFDTHKWQDFQVWRLLQPWEKR